MAGFLATNIRFAIIAIVILALRHAVGCRVPPFARYASTLTLAALLVMPFLPFCLPCAFPAIQLPIQPSMGPGGQPVSADTATAADFAAMASGSSSEYIPWSFLTGIWLFGVSLFSLRYALGAIKTNRAMWSRRIETPVWAQYAFEDCKRSVGRCRKAKLIILGDDSEPFTAGFIRPCVCISEACLAELSEAEWKCVVAHELAHVRHHDTLLNYLIAAMRALYWFNPMARLVLNAVIADREAVRDTLALSICGDGLRMAYAKTLAAIASRTQEKQHAHEAAFSHANLKIRVEYVVSGRQSRFQRSVGIGGCILLASALAMASPSLSLASSGDVYQWSPVEPVAELDATEAFQGFDGSFVLFDRAANTWLLYGGENATKRVSPESTYKLYDALFALEGGLISVEENTVAWDGSDQPFPEWEQDMDLRKAMDLSANWYFQALDMRMGKPMLASWLRTIKYGNADITGSLETYWLESTLKISPVEQVQLLGALDQDGLGVSRKTIEGVLESIDEGGGLYGKTGTGRIDGHDVNGWYIGLARRPEGTVYFAVNITAADGATGVEAARIAKSILQDAGYLTAG